MPPDTGGPGCEGAIFCNGFEDGLAAWSAVNDPQVDDQGSPPEGSRSLFAPSTDDFVFAELPRVPSRVYIRAWVNVPERAVPAEDDVMGLFGAVAVNPAGQIRAALYVGLTGSYVHVDLGERRLIWTPELPLPAATWTCVGILADRETRELRVYHEELLIGVAEVDEWPMPNRVVAGALRTRGVDVEAGVRIDGVVIAAENLGCR